MGELELKDMELSRLRVRVKELVQCIWEKGQEMKYEDRRAKSVAKVKKTTEWGITGRKRWE